MKKQVCIFSACAVLFMVCISTLINAQNIKIKYIDTNKVDAMAQLREQAIYKPQKQCRILSCSLTLYQRDQDTNLQSIIKKAHSPIYGVNDVYKIFQGNYPDQITRIDYVLTGKDGFRKSGYIDHFMIQKIKDLQHGMRQMLIPFAFLLMVVQCIIFTYLNIFIAGKSSLIFRRVKLEEQRMIPKKKK